MAASVSYRIDAGLKRRLAEQADRQGLTETALVERLLDEGLKTAEFPGIVYRGPSAARRAAVAGGPDVWEVVVGVRHARGAGDRKVVEAATQLGLPQRVVRLAVTFASAYPDEVEARIAANERAAEEVRQRAEARARLLAS